MGELRQLGSYQLQEELGRGGAGVVYRAIHVQGGSPVAIKTLSVPPRAGEDDAQPLRREVMACASLDHPGIVKVFELAAAQDGTPFLVMELLAGRPLRALVPRHSGSARPPLDIATVIALGRQLAAALQHAHERGVIHRDLKPENIMVVEDQMVVGGLRARILDFGIARLLQRPDFATLSRPDYAPGTPHYMAPEQRLPDREVGAPCDVYALGLILYELLCSASPFAEEWNGALHSFHVYQRPRNPRALRPDTPTGLSTLVLDMLRKLPTQRPTMAQVAQRLGGPLDRGARWPQLRRGPLGVACGLTLAVLGWQLWASPLAPPYGQSPQHTPGHQRRVQRPGAALFEFDSNVAGRTWAHVDVNRGPGPAIRLELYVHSNGARGAHVRGLVAFFDAQDRRLGELSLPVCGVRAARFYLGRYDEQHPRHCSQERTLPAAAQATAVRVLLKDADTNQDYFVPLSRSVEGQAEVLIQERLIPVLDVAPPPREAL